MADKVIYFPYIRVPENKWFTQVLLYWDEVGSIVPSEYIKHPERLGKYTGELVRAELVKPISPGSYIHEVPRFEEGFLKLIEENQIIAERMFALEHRETVRIHVEKFSPLIYDLCGMGLAQEAEDPWFEVERLTGDLYMAYLASVLGKSQDLMMEPITDRANSLSVYSTSPENISHPTDILSDLRIGVLEGILPAPAERIPVSELVKFKNLYFDLLSRFRRHVELSLIDIALIPDNNLRDEKVRLFKNELIDQIEEIREKMRERCWHRIVLGTVAAAIPLIGTAVSGNIPSALLGLPPLAVAIHSAYSGSKRKQEHIMSSPLAYAALAQENL